MTFEEFFNEKTKSNNKQFFNYLGITKKDHPKWEGWKIIDSVRDQGLELETYNNPDLQTLVINFYYIEYLKTMYY